MRSIKFGYFFKAVLFIFLNIFLVNFSFANWYHPHSVSYSSNGITRCDGDGDCQYDSNGNITSCVGNDYPNIDFDPNANGSQYRDYAVDINGDGKIDSNDYVSNGTSKTTSVSSNSSMTCFYWDGIAPNTDKLSLKLNNVSPGGNVLATNSANLVISYDDKDGGSNSSLSTITIWYELEDKDNGNFGSENSFTLATKNSTVSKTLTWNISKVTTNLDFSTSTGGRQYSIKITKICDEANNCITPNKVYSWWVYANNPIGYESINNSNLNTAKIANNGNEILLSINLKDQYGNPVIPAPGINRKVEVSINYNDNVYLNQYKLQGAGVKYKWILKNYTFSVIGNNKIFSGSYTSYDSVFSTGTYTIYFKSYVPTYDGYDKAYGSFQINQVNYSITDSLGSSWSNSLLVSSPNVLKFTPQVYTTISGIPPLAAEGTYKDFKISVHVSTTNFSDSTFLLQFDPKGSDLDTYLAYQVPINWGKYAIYAYKNSSLISYMTSNSENKIGTYSSISDLDNKTFYEKAVLKEGGTLDSSNQGVISTHIAVKYSDGTVAVWNSDLVGANNYNYNSVTNKYLVENAVDVKGLVGVSNNFKNKIYKILSGDKRSLAGIFSKIELRALFHKIIYKNFGNYSWTDIADGTKKFSDLNVSLTGNGANIYLVKGKAGILKVYGDRSIGESTLIITKGVDVYLSGNVTTSGKGLFGLIVLSDRDGKGGNIYLSNQVTNLEAYIYSDKALIGYKGDPSTSIITQESMSQDDLENQLRINGVLWTFNVLGGSVSGKCPYFDQSCQGSRKYDLEYLRRFYLVKDSIIDDKGDNNSYIPYGSPNTKLAGGISCQLKLDGSAKYTYCKDTDTNLPNLLKVGTSDTKMFTLPFTKNEKENIAPVIITFNPKAKFVYLPVFSELFGYK